MEKIPARRCKANYNTEESKKGIQNSARYFWKCCHSTIMILLLTKLNEINWHLKKNDYELILVCLCDSNTGDPYMYMHVFLVDI